ncbi:MAG: carbamate kinase [Planctomycetales bacterium]|nr:carbamate kinase [Planctomycetales bacterium]NIM08207.1 carbamate kinase [Planctomycetales bacterium]NIN07701.1 carbamate kinase [Planctomycetales bacterium]NIN76827.1 carbamate kinase [Planctomycetales bacterium]NIO34023.1 carbamate kinase [Planctomycetales bacterium]
MRVIIALGGNALLRRGQPLEAAVQQANIRTAAAALAEVARDHDLLVTHGNGPQVGLLALQSEALPDVQPYPLDVLDAESEGMLGYLIEQELSNLLPDREVAALLTRVEVDPHDPAFAAPSKPIGPVYDPRTAKRLAEQRGWSVAAEGSGFRRVVPSPKPLDILELRTIELLWNAGHLVICAGGGGIPVVRTAGGGLRGVEAVVDKDLAAAWLATALGADRLLLLTDVPAVWEDWPTPAQRALRTASPEGLQDLPLERGSMQPKVAAGCQFVEATGAVATIGALTDAAALLAGQRGTTIRADVERTEYYDALEVAAWQSSPHDPPLA